MSTDVTGTTGALYFATEQAKVAGGRATAAAGKSKGRKKGRIKGKQAAPVRKQMKKRQFFKNGVPVSEQEFYSFDRGVNIVKNPTSMEGFTDDTIKKIMGW